MTKHGDMSKSTETRKRILETAERLFEEIGIEATTQRKVAEVAGIQVSNVYYYFSSKRDLHLAIIVNHIENMTAQQSRLLEKARERFSDGNIPLGEILFAYASPRLFKMVRTPSRLRTEIFSYLETFDDDEIKKLRAAGMVNFERFLAAAKLILKDLSDAEIKLRFVLLESMLCGLAKTHRYIKDMFSGNISRETCKNMMMNFLVDGFSAARTI